MFMSFLVNEQTRSSTDFWALMIFGGLSNRSKEDRKLNNDRLYMKLKVDSGVFLIPQHSKSSCATSRGCAWFVTF